MTLNNFHYAMSLLETMYGITLQEDLFGEIALVGWNLIGNKRTRLYRYRTCIDGPENSVLLPCNVDEIEAITADFEEWDYSTNDTRNGNISSAIIEEYIEKRKAFRDPLYLPGKFVKYERVGDTLYFEKPYKIINILYKGIILDEEDLPEITDKEAMALATYCAYITKYKEGLMTNNINIIKLAESLKQQWNVLCDLARVDHYLSQNDWDQVLDAKTSWNRKMHGKSLKIFR